MKKKQPNILIIGDCCLDHTIYGTVHGVAPEAPIPVLKVKHEQYKVGMAANVAVQLKKYCEPTLWTFFKSKDTKEYYAPYKNYYIFKDRIKNLMNWKHFDIGLPLIIKQRTCVDNIYISRNDYEYVSPINIVKELNKRKYIKQLKTFDAIILSDYGKNVIGEPKELIKFLKQHTKANIFVDPDKFKLAIQYQDVYCIKANQKEAEAITLCTKGGGMYFYDRLIGLLGTYCHWPIITQGAVGVLSKIKQKFVFVAAQQVNTIDVTGAGDAFLASLVYHHCLGWDKKKCLKRANEDAAKCVQRFGV